ncbi:branched-chain amino acid ABC transporter permease [Thermosynechococcaceae cyanobacterium BACA0444]|uniref:Branched-chain amino acid ABC transporter permease n=1 Tax=Pseudocalidococcus azoricus BACA0444 TaxID=2918990 RepID=A0AAE4FRC0_9CYAN|nr:branched-chain amino acid ABC transporter permease [Pseudocalidococcus azoricus]MDS3860735.1 branched-chain amino acid ABC transporter permease [Pseudocalidococcus azoricus BACA0444]
MTQLLEAVFGGLSIGSVLLLSALGLAIVFGLMGVINMAHGELMMLGAYTTFVTQNILKATPLAPAYIFLALIAAFLVTALVGLLLERTVVRFLYGRPLETLLATWGVSLILQQFVRSVSWQFVTGLGIFCLLYFGAQSLLAWKTDFDRVRNWFIGIMLPLSAIIALVVSNVLGNAYKLAFTKPWFGTQGVDVTAPQWLRGGLVIDTYQLPYTRLFIIVLTILCLIAVYWFLNQTAWGLRIRAVTQNRAMSACLGIPTQKVDAITFALGSGLAGIAGCAVALLGSVSSNTGQAYIVDTFMVVVVGGVGKLVGSIVAAGTIGTLSYVIGSNALSPLIGFNEQIKAVLEFFATASMAKVVVFALIIVFLQFRPAGLFPQKGRTVDA